MVHFIQFKEQMIKMKLCVVIKQQSYYCAIITVIMGVHKIALANVKLNECKRIYNLGMFNAGHGYDCSHQIERSCGIRGIKNLLITAM